ncbi:MAG: DNA polymerase Y family protein [Myxococcales bacterium]|nr:DNA polymerase Y family protein [Myxococcales bacterium]
MDRWACVDLAALPLQLLLRTHPDWAEHPAAVVAEERPQAPILWVNERARRTRVLPGMRYAAGLSLARDLRAGVVSDAEVRAGVDEVVERLRRFTPRIEPAEREPWVLWLDAGGLGALFPSLRRWAEGIRDDLSAAGLRATVVVGFTRFGAYALAKTRSGVFVLPDPARERRAAEAAPLERLGLPPTLLATLAKLGVRTVGAFVALPRAGLRERFGAEAEGLHRLAAGEAWAPIDARPEVEVPSARWVLDFPERDAARLLFLTKRLLHPLLGRLVERGEALEILEVLFVLDGGRAREDAVRPAAPTLDAVRILDLLRLRLEGERLAAGVVEFVLTARGTPATDAQLRLFALSGLAPRRDLEAGARALARLRAEFGDAAVAVARLEEGHLPEARFAWAPVETLAAPHPGLVADAPLIRRLHAKALPLPPRSRHEPDGWIVRGHGDGPVVKSVGPHVLSGGWWVREVERHYHFVETARGDLLWIYDDRRRRRWFLQGEVE